MGFRKIIVIILIMLGAASGVRASGDDEGKMNKTGTSPSLLESLGDDAEERDAGSERVPKLCEGDGGETVSSQTEARDSLTQISNGLIYLSPRDDEWSGGKADSSKVELVVKEFRDRLIEKTNSFNKERGIISINGRTAVVGDVHGDYPTLIDIIDRLSGDLENGIIGHVLFLGDILDRGPSSSITLVRLFDFYDKYPGKVHLLRGNHETLEMYVSGECNSPAREDPLLRRIDLETMTDFFNSLPYAAIINDTTLAVHGGVPHRDYWEDFWRGERISEFDEESFKVIKGVLWSDYRKDGDGRSPNVHRGFREGSGVVFFGEDTTREFLSFGGKRGLCYLIRGHQPFGISFYQSTNNCVTTVFSAVNGQSFQVQWGGASVALVDKSGAPTEYIHLG